MKKHVNRKNLLVVGLLLAVISSYLSACKRESYTQGTTDDVNISGYLERDPATFSMMSEILERSGTAGYLGAYGEYTLFTPNNEAIKQWLTSIAKTQISDVSVAELKQFVTYHLVKDTLSTARFTDGKLRQPTILGQFLYTSVDQATSSYLINKQSLVVKSNIKTGNGLIHVINKVLLPPTKTVAQTLETNAKYSIFTAALKSTGFYDSLNYQPGSVPDTSRRFQTVIAESDSVLNSKQIFSIADLKTALKSTNPTNHKDSLWLYVAYHISPGANYLSDIKGLSALYTLAPKEVVTTKLNRTVVLLNDDEFNGVKEPGVPLSVANSDIMASNGVVHDANGSFKIKVRQQVPIYWDVAEQPELIAALGSNYRSTANGSFPLISNGASIASSISFENYGLITVGSNQYVLNHTVGVNSARVYHGEDLLQFSTVGSSRQQWVQIKSPFLVKGKYRIWICYGQQGTCPVMQVSIDHGTNQQQIMPNLVDFRQDLTGSGVTNATAGAANADNLMLAQGFKRYIAPSNQYVTVDGVSIRGQKPVNTTGWAANVGRLAGVADIQTTDRHTIRFTVVGGSAGNNMWLDMIHFIPVDDPEGKYPLVGNIDQLYPRFHTTPTVRFPRPL